MNQGTTVRFTYDDYLLLPEESRCEILDGDLQMSPASTARHQRIVLSPATANRDRTVKAKLYARAGVRELWLVDPDAKTVEVLSNGPAGFQRTSIAHAGETASSQLLLGLQVAVDKVL